MKKFGLILCILLWSCSQVSKPKGLISQDEMASIISESALYDNGMLYRQQQDMESANFYILKSHKVTGEQYKKSYEYYLANQELEQIFDLAKAKLLKMADPEVKEQIEERVGNGRSTISADQLKKID